jgi:hypothetical protein
MLMPHNLAIFDFILRGPKKEATTSQTRHCRKPKRETYVLK